MQNFKKFFSDWIVPILVAIVLSVLIKTFLFFNIQVPTGSMEPTIMPGDKIMVTRIYSTSKLKRGDIVVFYSKELKENLIKRLIGLPGDKVDVLTDGRVLVNEKPIEQKYVVYNGGRTGSFNVPKDKYLFLGDNRADSLDSRYWVNPYIDKSDIKGLARFIMFPFSRAGKFNK